MKSARVFIVIALAALATAADFEVQGTNESNVKPAMDEKAMMDMMQKPASPGAEHKKLDPAVRAAVSESYGKIPLSFEVNRGQTATKVTFLSRATATLCFSPRRNPCSL